MSDFKAKMHQIRFRLGLRPIPPAIVAQSGCSDCSRDCIVCSINMSIKMTTYTLSTDARKKPRFTIRL